MIYPQYKYSQFILSQHRRPNSYKHQHSSISSTSTSGYGIHTASDGGGGGEITPSPLRLGLEKLQNDVSLIAPGNVHIDDQNSDRQSSVMLVFCAYCGDSDMVKHPLIHVARLGKNRTVTEVRRLCVPSQQGVFGSIVQYVDRI